MKDFNLSIKRKTGFFVSLIIFGALLVLMPVNVIAKIVDVDAGNVTFSTSFDPN